MPGLKYRGEEPAEIGTTVHPAIARDDTAPLERAARGEDAPGGLRARQRAGIASGAITDRVDRRRVVMPASCVSGSVHWDSRRCCSPSRCRCGTST